METPTTETNKAIVRRWVDDVQNRGDVAAIDDYLTHDCVDHTVPTGFPADRLPKHHTRTPMEVAIPPGHASGARPAVGP
jgi:hypothetical protein